MPAVVMRNKKIQQQRLTAAPLGFTIGSMPVMEDFFPPANVRPVRGAGLLRGLNRLLPLGRKYHPLLRLLNGRHGLLLMSFGQYQVIEPATWSKAVATQLVTGTDMVAEFQVLKPVCQRCLTGHLLMSGPTSGFLPYRFAPLQPCPLSPTNRSRFFSSCWNGTSLTTSCPALRPVIWLAVTGAARSLFPPDLTVPLYGQLGEDMHLRRCRWQASGRLGDRSAKHPGRRHYERADNDARRRFGTTGEDCAAEN